MRVRVSPRAPITRVARFNVLFFVSDLRVGYQIGFKQELSQNRLLSTVAVAFTVLTAIFVLTLFMMGVLVLATGGLQITLKIPG